MGRGADEPARGQDEKTLNLGLGGGDRDGGGEGVANPWEPHFDPIFIFLNEKFLKECALCNQEHRSLLKEMPVGDPASL